MKWFLDTEFFERPGRIDLISVGLHALDGTSYYAENADFSWLRMERYAEHADDRISGTPKWLLENVRPHLSGERKRSEEIAADIRDVVGNKPEFYGWYCDYDWVVFCWLQGRMIDLPKGWPMFCRDLRQMCADMHVDTKTLPAQLGTEHNALDDAMWNADVYRHLKGRV